MVCVVPLNHVPPGPRRRRKTFSISSKFFLFFFRSFDTRRKRWFPLMFSFQYCIFFSFSSCRALRTDGALALIYRFITACDTSVVWPPQEFSTKPNTSFITLFNFVSPANSERTHKTFRQTDFINRFLACESTRRGLFFASDLVPLKPSSQCSCTKRRAPNVKKKKKKYEMGILYIRRWELLTHIYPNPDER